MIIFITTYKRCKNYVEWDLLMIKSMQHELYESCIRSLSQILFEIKIRKKSHEFF